MNEAEYERTMQEQALAGQSAETSTKQMQQQFYQEEQEKGMIKEQLDLTEEVKKITLLLRGYHQEYDVDTEGIKWIKPIDSSMVILTEYGINLILNSLGFYLNKNTLLSNYDAPTILTKMRDFSSALNKTIFMEYQKVFIQPSFEECTKVFEERINKKVKLTAFNQRMMGQVVDEKEIRTNLMLEMDDRIEKEIGKIKEGIIKTKLTRYMLLMREVQDVVHSTYLRAYMGMERKTLREHLNVTETRGGMPVQQSKGGMWGWLKG